jgi:hypothetical protein
MPVAAAIAGAAVIGAGSSIISGNKAAKAQKQAADASIAESRRQYDQDRADYAPWRATGESALGRLNTAMTDPSKSAFMASPGYQYRIDEATKAVQNSAAARGQLASGATMKALNRVIQGEASSEYNNWWNQNAGLAGVGQAAVNATSQAGQQSSQNIINATNNAGNARASSYANTGSSINSGINNVLSAYLFSKGGGFSQNPYTTPGYGTGR